MTSYLENVDVYEHISLGQDESETSERVDSDEREQEVGRKSEQTMSQCHKQAWRN